MNRRFTWYKRMVAYIVRKVGALLIQPAHERAMALDKWPRIKQRKTTINVLMIKPSLSIRRCCYRIITENERIRQRPLLLLWWKCLGLVIRMPAETMGYHTRPRPSKHIFHQRTRTGWRWSRARSHTHAQGIHGPLDERIEHHSSRHLRSVRALRGAYLWYRRNLPLSNTLRGMMTMWIELLLLLRGTGGGGLRNPYDESRATGSLGLHGSLPLASLLDIEYQ